MGLETVAAVAAEAVSLDAHLPSQKGFLCGGIGPQ
jgi:hypothetical protein